MCSSDLKSIFVEKLVARGYEVLLLNEPLDEIYVQNQKIWKRVQFQDVAKAGLKFGDEGRSLGSLSLAHLLISA